MGDQAASSSQVAVRAVAGAASASLNLDRKFRSSVVYREARAGLLGGPFGFAWER